MQTSHTTFSQLQEPKQICEIHGFFHDWNRVTFWRTLGEQNSTNL